MLYPAELRAPVSPKPHPQTSPSNRGAGIRTRDLLLPKQARYRAAPRPVGTKYIPSCEGKEGRRLRASAVGGLSGARCSDACGGAQAGRPGAVEYRAGPRR